MTIQIPIWSWPIILAAGAYMGCFLYTKNHKVSIALAIKAVLIGIACLVVIEFEKYLDNAFVGHYDEMGMPSHLTHSGWRLLIDAWPIWAVPLFIVLLVKFISIWVYVQLRGNEPVFEAKRHREHPMEKLALPKNANPNKMEFKTTGDHLALQEMRQKFELALKKYEEIKQERYQYQSKIRQLELAVAKQARQTDASPSNVNQEALQELKNIVEEQNQEVNEANELIEHLLEQLYDRKQSDD